MNVPVTIVFQLLIVILLHGALSGAEGGCQWNGYNFETLDKLPWNIVIQNGSSHIEYLVSLCHPLNSTVVGCQQNTSVCQISDREGVSLGMYNSSFENVMKEDAVKMELTLTLEGQTECKGGDPGQKMKTFIIFKCGKTLGSPVFVDSYACDTYFEWLTTAACKSPAKVNETKCYIYDTNGQLRDLSPLIKTQGSYLVETNEDDGGGELYINVCRDIVQSSGCSNSAACLFKNSSIISLGSVNSNSPLQLDADGSLTIVYSSANPEAGCSSLPSTKITFRCPARGKDGMPQLISSDECQYHVEWETEFACPAADLTSKTCQLSQPLHNIEIDLHSLATGRDDAFKVEAQDGKGQKYTYALNVCSQNLTNKGVLCGQNREVAICQFTNVGSSSTTKSLGQLEKQTLRYSDHQLSLTYEGGDPCHSGFQRKTVINFHCNETAGRGMPEFSGEDNCTYIFDWRTDLACIAAPLECQLFVGGVKYDLSRLIRSDHLDNWQMTDTETSDIVILNVCDHITKSDRLSVNCSAGAAICLIKNGNIARSLGKFRNSPIFDQETHSIKLFYTD